MKKYYVTMTDSFMSGWGMSEGKINKLVFECDNYNEADVVYKNAKNRSEMKYVNITANKPRYDKKRYYVQFENKDTYNNWYIDGNF